MLYKQQHKLNHVIFNNNEIV